MEIIIFISLSLLLFYLGYKHGEFGLYTEIEYKGEYINVFYWYGGHIIHSMCCVNLKSFPIEGLEKEIQLGKQKALEYIEKEKQLRKRIKNLKL